MMKIRFRWEIEDLSKLVSVFGIYYLERSVFTRVIDDGEVFV